MYRAIPHPTCEYCNQRLNKNIIAMLLIIRNKNSSLKVDEIMLLYTSEASYAGEFPCRTMIKGIKGTVLNNLWDFEFWQILVQKYCRWGYDGRANDELLIGGRMDSNLVRRRLVCRWYSLFDAGHGDSSPRRWRGNVVIFVCHYRIVMSRSLYFRDAGNLFVLWQILVDCVVIGWLEGVRVVWVEPGAGRDICRHGLNFTISYYNIIL